MQNCGGCRGYSDLPLKVSGGRIISSYLWLLSKPLSAHLAPSFPLLSLLWKSNRVSDAAGAAKARRGERAGDGGAGSRQGFTGELSRSRPASLRALSRGISWERSHVSTLAVLVPDPLELSVVWSMGFAWGEPRGLEGPPELPRPLLTPEATLHPHHEPFLNPSPPWCSMPQRLAGLCFSAPFPASRSSPCSSVPSDKALLSVGAGERNAFGTGWRGRLALWAYAWMEMQPWTLELFFFLMCWKQTGLAPMGRGCRVGTALGPRETGLSTCPCWEFPSEVPPADRQRKVN